MIIQHACLSLGVLYLCAGAGSNGDLWVACLSGAVVHVDLASNASNTIHHEPGVALSGAKFCREQQLLFVAGSLSGKGYIFHVKPANSSAGSSSSSGSGTRIAHDPGSAAQQQFVVSKREVIHLALPAVSYINDVALGPDRAYFTDSFHNVIYSIPRYASEGRTGAAENSAGLQHRQVLRHPTGPFFDTKLGQYRANGIAVYSSTQQNDSLLVANTHTGNMYKVVIDKEGGEAGSKSSASTLRAASEAPAPTAGGQLPSLVGKLVLHSKQMPPALVQEFALPSVKNSRVNNRLLLDGVWVLNSSMAFVADNYNNRVWGLRIGEGMSDVSIACLVQLPVFGVPTTITFSQGMLWVTNAHLDTCFPFLPCPKHAFEVLGINPDECQPWP